MEKIIEVVCKLFSVKSIVTIVLTASLVYMIVAPECNPSKEVLALFCTSYGAVITYFFTKKDGDSK